MSFSDAKQRFSNRAADYARYRPSYPSALYDLLVKECTLCPEHVIADVGSGTGLLSKLFLDHGNRVYGVEPNAEMRAGGQEFLGGYSNFQSVAASAEYTRLADHSFDFITVGQAFHWFDVAAAQREFRRILKPSGWAVIVSQDRRMNETPFAQEYERLLQRFGIDYKRIKDAYPEQEKMCQLFAHSSFKLHTLPNHQDFDWDGLQGRLRSSSYAPTENDPNYDQMLKELHRIFRTYQTNGTIRMEYVANIYLARLHRNTL